jgi:hypothetical protein
MTKKEKSLDDVYYPVPQDLSSATEERLAGSKKVIKRIVQAAVKTAYSLKPPSQWDLERNQTKPTALATQDQMEMVVHLIESLQPADAVEAALASQFAVTYIRGMGDISEYTVPIELFEFGHKVLEALQKYRSRGAQQINVQYNVNRGQVVNIKAAEDKQ